MFFRKQAGRSQELDKSSPGVGRGRGRGQQDMRKHTLKNIEVYVSGNDKDDFVNLSGTLTSEFYYIRLCYFVDLRVSIEIRLKSGEKMTSWAYFKNVDELVLVWREAVSKVLSLSDVERAEIVFTATAKDPSEETDGYPGFDKLNTSDPRYRLISSRSATVHPDELENADESYIENLFHAKADPMYEDLVTQLTILLNELLL